MRNKKYFSSWIVDWLDGHRETWDDCYDSERWGFTQIKKIVKDEKIVGSILDAGCGQGLLVKEFKERGYDIIGVDAFYGNDLVKKEDILKTGFESNSFDVILCLIELYVLVEFYVFDRIIICGIFDRFLCSIEFYS